MDHVETKSDCEPESEAFQEVKPIQSKTNKKSKDSKNNDELQVQENPPFIWKSDEIRFNYFPESFDDWSEDQEKDAYINNFKLYLHKYLKRTI